jgi:tRNA(Ile)-lysidine synthase
LYRELLKEKLSCLVEEQGGVSVMARRNDEAIQGVALDRPATLAMTQSEQLLFEWLRQYGFNTDQCHFIFEAMETGIGNKYYSPTHQLIIGRNELQLSEIKSVVDAEIQIEVGEKELFLPIHLQFFKLGKTVDFVIDKSPEVAQLDFDKIRFPLTLRHWRHGDRFHPLGMKGSKLLSDFFVDQKFTEWQKQNVWLLMSADGDILWVVGQRIDDRYKVSSATKTVFRCEMKG